MEVLLPPVRILPVLEGAAGGRLGGRVLTPLAGPDPDVQECPICLMDLVDGGELSHSLHASAPCMRMLSHPVIAIQVTPCCGNSFHAECLQRWGRSQLRLQGAPPSHQTCPLCRSNLREAQLGQASIFARAGLGRRAAANDNALA